MNSLVCYRIFFSLISVASFSSAMSATKGAILLLATIPSTTSISVVGIGGYQSLNLSESTADLTVARVREMNNSPFGYVVSISSSNAGRLRNGTHSDIIYTAKYNGNSFTLSTSPVTITTAAASNSAVDIVKDLRISYTGIDANTMPAGTYSDTLTVSIGTP